MQPSEYAGYDATGLAELIATGQVSAPEVLDAARAAIESTNRQLNAVVHLIDDPGEAAPGPLSGVPFLIKDLGPSVTGTVTTSGSRLFASGPPARHDSVVVRRYRVAGLVIMGKTNTPEMGLTPTTEPALFGPARNPADPSRTPGGSSGGAAAAVAAGMVPAAHASDGGGSIRIPASCCGLFGLKPTRGRVTYAPERGEGWAGMSTQHAVTRSVRDSAALLDATAGPGPGDPYWPALPAGSFSSAAARDPGSLRVCLLDRSPAGVAVDPECREAAAATAHLLEDLGHHVEAGEWPFRGELLAQAQAGIIAANVAAAVQIRLADLGRDLEEGDLEPVTAAMVEWGQATTAVDYLRAVGAMHEVGRRMAGLFDSFDAVVTPTLACLPPPVGHLDGSDVDAYLSRVTPMVTFTSLVNMSGQPAVSLPLTRSASGLPVGTQVIGSYGDEAGLLSLAAQVERARPWSLLPRA